MSDLVLKLVCLVFALLIGSVAGNHADDFNYGFVATMAGFSWLYLWLKSDNK